MTNSSDAQSPSSGLRLLVVEDNPSTLRLLRFMLEDNHEVDAARSVDEALFLAREHYYEAFIIDINLSERKTGIEVLHALRRMPKYTQAPVVAYSDYALKEHQALFQEAGFSIILSKPVAKPALMAGIQAAIDDPMPEPISFDRSIYDAAELPPLPSSIPELLALIGRDGREESDFERLIDIVSRDAVMSTWLIGRANSAFFKVGADIDSLEQAARHVGFRPVCNLLLGKLISQEYADFETGQEERVYEHIMQVGMGAAYLARALASSVDYPHPEIAYSAVLLSQLGRLLLLDKRRERYAQLWYEEAGTFVGPPPIGHEALFVNANYVTLGAEVGHRNNFSDTLLTAIRYHHRPADVRGEDRKLLLFIVATGLQVYAAMQDKEANELLPVLQKSYPLKGCAELSGVARRDLMSIVQERFEDARVFAAEVLAEDRT